MLSETACYKICHHKLVIIALCISLQSELCIKQVITYFTPGKCHVHGTVFHLLTRHLTIHGHLYH